MVEMWTEDDRRELAEHCREHDRLMAEEHVPALRDELITKENAADLIFKKIQRPAPQPEESQDWSGWERWLRAHLDNNNAELVEVFTNAVAEALAEIQHAIVKRVLPIRPNSLRCAPPTRQNLLRCVHRLKL